MKKTLLILTLLAACATVQAQEVYDYLLDKQQQVINNPASKDFDLKVSQFEYTAMRWFRKTGIQKQGGVQSTWLDAQALALSSFVTSFFKELSKFSTAEDKARKGLIQKYIKASQDNPMFTDIDKSEAESFVNAPGGFTPFSLNTDWVKANAAIEAK